MNTPDFTAVITPVLLLLAIEYAGVFLAVISDLASGLHKAKARGEKCTSWGLRRTVDKISRYYIALFAVTLVDVMAMAAASALPDDFPVTLPIFPFLTTVSSISLALIEVKSICERSEDKEDIRKVISGILKFLRSSKP